MGNTLNTGANDFALGTMAKGSHFTKDELQQFQKSFMEVAGESKDIGTTVISQAQFGKAIANCNVPAANGSFLSLLFNAFDKNGDGAVNFVEFTAGLAIVLKGARRPRTLAPARRERVGAHPGTPQEKYQLCFEIYDTGKTGTITKAEMRQVALPCTTARSHAANPQPTGAGAEFHECGAARLGGLQPRILRRGP